MAENHEANEIVEKDWVDLPEEGIPFMLVVSGLVIAGLASLGIHYWGAPRRIAARECFAQNFSCRLERDGLVLMDGNGGKEKVTIVWEEP